VGGLLATVGGLWSDGGWPVERRWVACGVAVGGLWSGVEWLICGGTGTWLRN